MREKTISDILGDFSPSQDVKSETVKSGGPVTIWLPRGKKAEYDLLQKQSGRQFSKRARELLIELINVAQARMAG